MVTPALPAVGQCDKVAYLSFVMSWLGQLVSGVKIASHLEAIESHEVSAVLIIRDML
jgi:hypothetical protein